MRHLPRLLARSALALLLGLVPAAADTFARIEATATLRVGLTGDYKPFSWESPQGQFEGLDVDMAEALADELGVRLEIVPTSWPSLMDDLASDEFDIGMGGISVTEERKEHAFFSTPLLTDGKTPIARCENAARFQTLDQIDRAGVTLIVNPGGTNEKFARANIEAAKIILHKDNASIFDEIVEGRADLMITDAIETRIMAKQHPELCAIHPDDPFTQSEKAYLLPQDEAWKARVDAWIAAMEASGETAAVFEKWLE